MFLKPFRVKTSTTIKSSERKKWKCRFESTFRLTSDELDALIPNKSEVSIAKIETFNGEKVNVYCAQKNPLFFEIENELFPTVYTLWKHPDLLHTFTTWSQVFPKISGGADLMLPGIVLPPTQSTELNPRSYGKFEKGMPCAVNTTENKAPLAVGRTAHSSMDMFMAARRGKGVIILHFYTDQLWEFGDKCMIVSLGSPFALQISDDDSTEELENEAKELNLADNDIQVDLNSDEIENKETNEIEDKSEEIIEKFATMDEVLVYTFMKTIKSMGKGINFPILSSSFYKTMMLPNCPAGFQLNIKETSFKKLSKFLGTMQEEGYIQVQEMTKGVESITSINFANENLKAFVIEDEVHVEKVEAKAGNVYTPPVLEQIYFVNSEVLPLFKLYEFKKGSHLTIPEIRDVFKRYIADKGLKNPENKRIVNMDALLEKILNRKEPTLAWDQAMQLCMNKMKSGSRVSFVGQEPRIIKEELRPIEIAVAKRAANKTVTLVTNLELFGLDPNQIAHTIQVRVATSTSVNPTPNKKEGSQVLIQGNQVHHLSKLLLDEYKIPKKYVRGLELAKKKR